MLSFFSLPREIRDQIYHIVLKAQTSLDPHQHRRLKKYGLGIEVQLLRACRQVHAEASIVMPKVNALVKLSFDRDNTVHVLTELGSPMLHVENMCGSVDDQVLLHTTLFSDSTSEFVRESILVTLRDHDKIVQILADQYFADTHAALTAAIVIDVQIHSCAYRNQVRLPCHTGANESLTATLLAPYRKHFRDCSANVKGGDSTSQLYAATRYDMGRPHSNEQLHMMAARIQRHSLLSTMSIRTICDLLFINCLKKQASVAQSFHERRVQSNQVGLILSGQNVGLPDLFDLGEALCSIADLYLDTLLRWMLRIDRGLSFDGGPRRAKEGFDEVLNAARRIKTIRPNILRESSPQWTPDQNILDKIVNCTLAAARRTTDPQAVDIAFTLMTDMAHTLAPQLPHSLTKVWKERRIAMINALLHTV